jgi:hypothetical protein
MPGAANTEETESVRPTGEKLFIARRRLTKQAMHWLLARHMEHMERTPLIFKTSQLLHGLSIIKQIETSSVP